MGWNKSIKKKIDCNDKTEYLLTSIKEILNWLPFWDIIEFTADRIDHYKKLLPSLLKMFSMFKIKCWYNPGGVKKNISEKISIRCSNRGKETMVDVDNLNTTY